jgi:hypothetical protein
MHKTAMVMAVAAATVVAIGVAACSGGKGGGAGTTAGKPGNAPAMKVPAGVPADAIGLVVFNAPGSLDDLLAYSLLGEMSAASQSAFWDFCGIENLEEQWSPDDEPEKIDPVILAFIRERFGEK